MNFEQFLQICEDRIKTGKDRCVCKEPIESGNSPMICAGCGNISKELYSRTYTHSLSTPVRQCVNCGYYDNPTDNEKQANKHSVALAAIASLDKVMESGEINGEDFREALLKIVASVTDVE